MTAPDVLDADRVNALLHEAEAKLAAAPAEQRQSVFDAVTAIFHAVEMESDVRDVAARAVIDLADRYGVVPAAQHQDNE